jgi:hypothetical protein
MDYIHVDEVQLQHDFTLAKQYTLCIGGVFAGLAVIMLLAWCINRKQNAILLRHQRRTEAFEQLQAKRKLRMQKQLHSSVRYK